MRSVIYICVLIFCFSCKSVVTAQENELKDSVVTKKKPKYSEIANDQIAPSTIRFIGKIVKIEKEPTSICGTIYTHVATIEVVNVIASGSGIINICNKDEQIQMVFTMGFSTVSDERKNILPGIKTGQNFKADAFEKLCKSSSNTIYFISSYTIQ
ncbi:MAG: hypothetical protein L3J20_07785 [Flavobacteriaceae bacterium]|nr:hypothetical protein [Flavobacteriaceae bacterium]